MANRIEQARAAVDACIREAYLRAAAAGDLPEGADVRGSVEQPKDTANGDFAANHAMASAKTMHMAPRKIAEALIAHMELDGTWFASVEAAGPGFLHVRLSDKWYQDVLTAVDEAGADYGRVDDGHGEKVMVEFVSANPTGPMTIGNARGGVLGDALASVLERAGYNVWREFYVNDAGNQVDLFGKSIEARYLQLIEGEDAVEFPDNGYHGDDIRELAKLIYERDGDKYLTMPSAERCAAFVAFGLPYNIARMQRDLERYRIHFDQWFLESSLHSSGYVTETVQLLVDAGLTYEKDGALWLRNTDLGADKDEVLRRSNGFYTYYAVDIAYHRNKFIERGFDRVIDVWGADPHGHAIRFAATMRAPALGLEGRKLDFLIMQMVRLMRGDEIVKVSKRTGKALSLADLMDEIGVDACRSRSLTSWTRSAWTPAASSSTPSRTRTSSSTSTSPCGRTAKTPSTTSSMRTRASARCWLPWRRAAAPCLPRRMSTQRCSRRRRSVSSSSSSPCSRRRSTSLRAITIPAASTAM